MLNWFLLYHQGLVLVWVVRCLCLRCSAGQASLWLGLELDNKKIEEFKHDLNLNISWVVLDKTKLNLIIWRTLWHKGWNIFETCLLTKNSKVCAIKSLSLGDGLWWILLKLIRSRLRVFKNLAKWHFSVAANADRSIPRPSKSYQTSREP